MSYSLWNLQNASSTASDVANFSSGTEGMVQLADGNGSFIHNPTIYAIDSGTSAPANQLIFDSTSNTDNNEPISGIVFKPASGPSIAAFTGEPGAIVYGDPAGTGVDFYGWKGLLGPWISLTNTGGGAVAAGANTEIQFNAGGAFAANANMTFDTGVAPSQFRLGQLTAVDTIFNGTFLVEDTIAGSSSFQINNATVSGIKLKTSPPAGVIDIGVSDLASVSADRLLLHTDVGNIRLDSIDGDIRQETTGNGDIRSETVDGRIILQSDNSSIKLTHGVGAAETFVELGTNGDLSLVTEAINNEIRLTTNAVGSEIILQTNSAQTDIQLNATGITSDIDLTATEAINATSEDVNISNAASNGSLITMVGPGGNDNITIDGSSGTMVLGATGSTGNLEIRNLPLGVSDTVGQFNVDVNNSGLLTLYKGGPGAGSAVSSISLTGETAHGAFGGTNTNGLITLAEIGNTTISIEAPNSKVRLLGLTGTATDLDRVVLMGQPTASGATNQPVGFAAASNLNGGIAATIYGGLTILPNREYNGIVNAPMPDSNILLGQYGWNTTAGQDAGNVYLSVANDSSSIAYGGSGNIYCNQVRQNIYSNGPDTPVPGPIICPPNAGYTGNSGNQQYYNGGNVRYITLAVGNEPNVAKDVILPPINEAMLGMTITVVRLRQNATWYPGNNAAGIPRSEVAVIVYPAGADLMSAPPSIFIQGGGLPAGAVAIDPFVVLGAAYLLPVPYTSIGSATFIASQFGDGQLAQSPARYFWHYIDSYPAK